MKGRTERRELGNSLAGSHLFVAEAAEGGRILAAAGSPRMTAADSAKSAADAESRKGKIIRATATNGCAPEEGHPWAKKWRVAKVRGKILKLYECGAGGVAQGANGGVEFSADSATISEVAKCSGSRKNRPGDDQGEATGGWRLVAWAAGAG